MKELSMHVYDLMENSTAANSTLVELPIRDSLKDNIYAFTIKDNGKGMTPERQHIRLHHQGQRQGHDARVFGQGDRPLDDLTHYA